MAFENSGTSKRPYIWECTGMPRDDDDVDGNEFGSTLISFPQICLPIDPHSPQQQQ